MRIQRGPHAKIDLFTIISIQATTQHIRVKCLIFKWK